MFTVLDYIIMGFALVCSIWAAIKGFIDEISSKFGYVLGFLVALMFTCLLSSLFQKEIGLPKLFASFLSYVILFVTGYILMRLLGMMLTTITETAHLGAVNNVLGFILGLTEAVLVTGMIETVLYHQNTFNLVPYFKKSYFSSEVILPFFNSIKNWVSGLI